MSVRTVQKKLVLPELPKAIRRRNVAAYARVSTGSREQENSLESQKSFYEKYIRSHDLWNYAGLYVDEGISGLSTRNRDGFNRLIEDALSGGIDLIVTKSISRFARNTVDTLTAIRKLKAAGVEVYFEKEEIYTFDSKGEFILSLMSSFAQEESRSISENVKWSKRKAFADGRYSVGYRCFLGYDKGEDAPLKINEDEAKTVRLIYLWFMEGRTAFAIAKMLTELHIPTPGGKVKWTAMVVESILSNEKYKGDALLQKQYTIDFINKRMVRNTGELPQYYLRDDHPAIIPRDIHEYVEAVRNERRVRYGCSYSGHWAFSTRIICKCGTPYGKRYANHYGKYPYDRWICKNPDESVPHSPPINDSALQLIARCSVRELIESREDVIRQTVSVICQHFSDRKPAIEAFAESLCTEDVSQPLFREETLRILIKTIIVDDQRNVTVQFINGFCGSPRNASLKYWKKRHKMA